MREKTERKIIYCTECCFWKELASKPNSNWRKGYCIFWKNMDKVTFEDDFCSQACYPRK